MLRELLALLSDGKALSQYVLAVRLEATPEAIMPALIFCATRAICGTSARRTWQRAAAKMRRPLGSIVPGNVPAIWEAVK
jgi:hypothetical protein